MFVPIRAIDHTELWDKFAQSSCKCLNYTSSKLQELLDDGCRDWLDQYKSKIQREEERLRKEEEESRPIGPAPPPKSRVDDPSSYGINLRPGEGERCVFDSHRLLTLQ